MTVGSHGVTCDTMSTVTSQQQDFCNSVPLQQPACPTHQHQHKRPDRPWQQQPLHVILNKKVVVTAGAPLRRTAWAPEPQLELPYRRHCSSGIRSCPCPGTCLQVCQRSEHIPTALHTRTRLPSRTALHWQEHMLGTRESCLEWSNKTLGARAHCNQRRHRSTSGRRSPPTQCPHRLRTQACHPALLPPATRKTLRSTSQLMSFTRSHTQSCALHSQQQVQSEAKRYLANAVTWVQEHHTKSPGRQQPPGARCAKP